MRDDMWYSSSGFHCAAPSADVASYGDVYLKVLPAAVLWGAGTALGEVPPYAVSYQATKLGRKTAEIDVALGQQHRAHTNALASMAAQTKDWMIAFIKRRGFWGVLLLASWPNAAFDLCGICCGAFMMPFWEFLLATLLGKGIIKARVTIFCYSVTVPIQVNGQAAFFVLLFRRQSRERLLHLLDLLLPARLPMLGGSPAQLLNATLARRIAEFQAGVARREAARVADPR